MVAKRRHEPAAGMCAILSTMSTALNEVMLQGNTCFGCSPTNPDGLRIRIFEDGDDPLRLVGEYEPRETQAGFPSIVHGGLQFTALDCMAAWTVFGRRGAERLMPLTHSATIRYRRPVALGVPLQLSAEVVSTKAADADSRAERVLRIHTELRDQHGQVLTAVDFDYVALPEATFREMMGLEELPECFRRHFGQLE